MITCKFLLINDFLKKYIVCEACAISRTLTPPRDPLAPQEEEEEEGGGGGGGREEEEEEGGGRRKYNHMNF